MDLFIDRFGIGKNVDYLKKKNNINDKRVLTAFNNLKIMSEVAHVNCNRLKLFTGFIN
jgi:hypothetical protein